jgi:hypothetical protein
VPAPEASPAALELYEALDPALTRPDPDFDYACLKTCIALTTGNIDLIHEIVSDTPQAPGWQILLDPQRCPAVCLPFLGQFVGAHLKPDMTEEQMRTAISDPEVFGRGSPEAIVSVAKRRLEGTKTVTLIERYTGLAYRMKIVTLESETPDPAATLADILEEQKPMGIRLFFNAAPDWTWEELMEEKATWDDVVADFPTWDSVVTREL